MDIVEVTIKRVRVLSHAADKLTCVVFVPTIKCIIFI